MNPLKLFRNFSAAVPVLISVMSFGLLIVADLGLTWGERTFYLVFAAALFAISLPDYLRLLSPKWRDVLGAGLLGAGLLGFCWLDMCPEPHWLRGILEFGGAAAIFLSLAQLITK